jgi:hypothetical protein
MVFFFFLFLFSFSFKGEQVDPVQLKALEIEDTNAPEDEVEEVQGTQSSQMSQVPSSQIQSSPNVSQSATPAPRRTPRARR